MNSPPMPGNTGRCQRMRVVSDVSWGSDGDTLAMSWTEREGPLVSAPTRRGFGTIVHGSDGGAQRGRQGRPRLCALRPDLALTCPPRTRWSPGSVRKFQVKGQIERTARLEKSRSARFAENVRRRWRLLWSPTDPLRPPASDWTMVESPRPAQRTTQPPSDRVAACSG